MISLIWLLVGGSTLYCSEAANVTSLGEKVGSHTKSDSTKYLIFMDIAFVAVKDGFAWQACRENDWVKSTQR